LNGALGDGIIASSLLPYLAKDGYRITINASQNVLDMLRYNPYVYDTMPHVDGSIDSENLDEHWANVGKGFDKVVNLTGTMENNYIFAFPQPEYYKCLAWKRKQSKGVNWYDNQITKAGYKPNRPLGELYFSQEEKRIAKEFRRKHKKAFIILWALFGSSVQKVYRYFEIVARRVLDEFKDSIIIPTANYQGKLLTFEHERVINLPQLEKSFRYSAALAKYADLVLGPETGLLNAAGCFKTPKICFLTHSSKQNLTKHWYNDYSIQADTYCSPCYLLHKYRGIWRNHCQLNDLGYPKCTESPAPGVLIDTIRRVYNGRPNIHKKSKNDRAARCRRR
jgi:ADP-heptose:LPS heptosyltransferase